MGPQQRWRASVGCVYKLCVKGEVDGFASKLRERIVGMSMRVKVHREAVCAN